MRKKKLMIPAAYKGKIRAMWQDGEGCWATAAPGYCFDTLSGYTLTAESEAELVFGLQRRTPEEYDLLDVTGTPQQTMSYGDACRLLRDLRPDYAIVSHTTGENFEKIQPNVCRRRIAYQRFEQGDGVVSYHTQMIHAQVREEQSDGKLRLLPIEGALAIIHRDWTELPDAGLRSFCTALENQINREAQQETGLQYILRVMGDPDIPLVSVLMELVHYQPEALKGLIDILPTEGEDLCITEINQLRPPYLKALQDITEFLRSNGFVEAASFLDNGFDR